ncbi:MAG TPA: hypothetical protein VF438_00910 [Candidatus Paceibacterota bacterium]
MDETNIPTQVQDLADSAELFTLCRKIGDEFNLNLDQIGELDSQIRWVLRGHANASSFSTDIQSLLEIDADKARMITNRINKDVFDTLKNLMDAHATETSLQAIEKAGDFEIERPRATIPVRENVNILEEEPQDAIASSESIEQKRDIVEGIENPAPAVMKPAETQQYPKKEPLVEQLLRGTTAVPEQKIVRSAPIEPKKSAPVSVPPRPAGSDPYREAID